MNTTGERRRPREIHMQHRHEVHLELIKATHAFEQRASQLPLTLNGGALIAFFGFLGATAKEPTHRIIDVDQALCAAVVWSFGLFVSALVIWLAYHSQYAFLKAARRKTGESRASLRGDPDTALQQAKAHEEWDDTGYSERKYATILGTIALGCFLLGGIFASQSVLSN
jgi:hypothetical protein